MLQRYRGRPAGGGESHRERPPESWRGTLRDGACLRTAVDPAFIKGIIADVSVNQASPDALRAFYALLTAELLLSRVQGLTKRVAFSGSTPLLP